MGVSMATGVPPKWMVYNGKSHLNGWFGGTPIYGNPQMVFVACFHYSCRGFKLKNMVAKPAKGEQGALYQSLPGDWFNKFYAQVCQVCCPECGQIWGSGWINMYIYNCLKKCFHKKWIPLFHYIWYLNIHMTSPNSSTKSRHPLGLFFWWSQEPTYSWMICLFHLLFPKNTTQCSLILVILVICGCKARFYLYTSLHLSLSLSIFLSTCMYNIYIYISVSYIYIYMYI